MITFEDHDELLILAYSSDYSSMSWVDDALNDVRPTIISRVFSVHSANLLNQGADGDEVRRFVIGSVDDQYRTIRANVLGLKHDLLITKSLQLKRSLFVAERNISIFRRIDNLVAEQIAIGGRRHGAIPESEFGLLLKRFPTSTEVTRYADARISRIIGEYLETISDAEQQLEKYVNDRERTSGVQRKASVRAPAANVLEIEKFTYVRDRLVEMLKDAESFTEGQWQVVVADLFLLVFPQYISILHEVRVKEWYSSQSGFTNRFLDLMLVAANGSVDVIEIKKPFERGLMSRRRYRNNHVALRGLSGSILQAEKYLFYLSKSGRDGERAITEAYASELPPGLEIRIANPKAIILAGRDTNMSDDERFDFEFVRRQHSNIVDIISYDDLLRRLENVIVALTQRVGGGDDAEPGAVVGVSR